MDASVAKLTKYEVGNGKWENEMRNVENEE